MLWSCTEQRQGNVQKSVLFLGLLIRLLIFFAVLVAVAV